jgi:hypothetical protein
MGRFEDLLQQARDGDAAALDALGTEFSGSALREKAENAESYQAKLEANLPLIRKAKFADLFDQLDDELKASGLTAESLGEFDPDDLTLESVQLKAKSKLDEVQAGRLATAQAAGFDNVEEFDQAMETVKKQADERKANMESVGAGASSSGGEPAGSGEETDRHEIMQEAFAEAKKAGKADDRAMGAGIAALIDAQLEEGGE